MPLYLSEASRTYNQIRRIHPQDPVAQLAYYLPDASVPTDRSADETPRERAASSSSSSSSSYSSRLVNLIRRGRDSSTSPGSGSIGRLLMSAKSWSAFSSSSSVAAAAAAAAAAATEKKAAGFTPETSGFSEPTLMEPSFSEHFQKSYLQVGLLNKNSAAYRDHSHRQHRQARRLADSSANSKRSLFADSAPRPQLAAARTRRRKINRLNRRMLMATGNGQHMVTGNAYALSELFSQSEIPGFREIFASDSYLRKFCWIVAFLFMTVLSLNDMTELITEYYEYPITVDVRLRDSARLPFPAVTVCNLNVVRFSSLCSNSRFDLTNQIPSELRDKLCGIQVEKKKTGNGSSSGGDSDISDINNIGITTTLGTSSPPPAATATTTAATATTTTMATSTNASSADPAALLTSPRPNEGPGGANPSRNQFAEPPPPPFPELPPVQHKQSGEQVTTSIGPMATTISPMASMTSPAAIMSPQAITGPSRPSWPPTRRTTASGSLDLDDFVGPSLVSGGGGRRRTPRSIRLADGSRPFAGRQAIRLASGGPDERSKQVSGQLGKLNVVNVPASRSQQPGQTFLGQRAPGANSNNQNQNSPGHSPIGVGGPSMPAAASTQAPGNQTFPTAFNPTALPDDFELTERRERELQENLTNWLAVMYQRDAQLTRSLGHQFDDMILRCTMKSINCTRQKSFENSFSPTEGNCFTYRSKVKRRPLVAGGQRKSSLSRPDQSMGFEEANLAGTNDGLELVLNLEKSEYISGSSQVGALVMIHHPSDLGYAASEATFIAPEFTTYIGLKMVNITRLPAPYPEFCVDSWPAKFADTLTRNSTYSQQACLKICLQKTIQSHCQCQSAFLPIVELDGQPMANSSSASSSSSSSASYSSAPAVQSQPLVAGTTANEQQQQPQRIIICDTRKQSTRQCVREVNLRAADRVHNCECPPKCQVVRYDKTISMARWPTREDKVSFDRGKMDVNFQNLAKVIVYFQTMTCEEVSQQAVFNAAKLFSALGGIMGMYVGFSFLSVFEIFEVMSRKLWHYLTVRLNHTTRRVVGNFNG